MKSILQLISVFLLFVSILPLKAQVNCSSKFSRQDIQATETKPLTISSTMDYEYEIYFQVTDAGIYLTITSTDIHPFEKENTRIQFVTEDNEKFVLNFINDNKKTTLRSRDANYNTLLLNFTVLELFATKGMVSLRVVNMTQNRLYVRSILKVAELKELAGCVYGVTDPAKIKNTHLDLGLKPNPQANKTTVSPNKTQESNPGNTTLKKPCDDMSQQELADLRKKIEADKALMNRELVVLRAKNAELKKTLAEENVKIRENADKEKLAIAGEVKNLRQKIYDDLILSREAAANEKADISAEVAQNRQKANE